MEILLIIHDNILINISISNFLSSKGYEVSSFTSGEGAILEMEKTKFDLVVVDLNLPNFNVDDTIKEVRAKCGTIPLVGLTSLNLMMDNKIAREFFAILPNNVSEEELENVIKEALGKRKG